MDDGVAVRMAEPLRFLQPQRDRRSGVRRLALDPDATVGHLVQAAGVPLTEAGALLLPRQVPEVVLTSVLPTDDESRADQLAWTAYYAAGMLAATTATASSTAVRRCPRRPKL